MINYMSSNIMIQLRQADAQTITANGEYECILSRDITIENNDVVQLSKAFIDSVSEGDINIIEDLTLTIESGVYITNWTTLTGDFINNENENIPCTNETSSTAPCFKRFVPYLGIDDLTNFSNYLQYDFLLNYSGPTVPSFVVTFSYIDFTNAIKYVHSSFPSIPAGSYKNSRRFVTTFNIIAKTDSVKIVYPSNTFFNSIGISPIGAEATTITTKQYTPFNFTTNINLPKGVYSPNQLATFISQSLSVSGLTRDSTSEKFNNSFFQFAITDFDQGKANPNGQLSPTPPFLPVPLAEQTTFISDDGILSYVFPPNNNTIIGTSQISLDYNQQSNSFQFTYLHMPMLDATVGQNISVRYLERGLVQNAGVYGVSEHSGVYFTSLTAKNNAGRFVDFWSGILGFNLDELCVGISSNAVDTYGLTGIINLIEPLVDGTNSTSGYYGLDSGIIRGTAGSGETDAKPNTWYSRQIVPYHWGDANASSVEEAQDGINSTINSTNYISAEKTLDILLNKFSHYFLQTDLGFNDNNFIGEKWYRNINGVITKYYSYGSYTFAESDSAIQYIHKGSPIQLKSVRVRLLKSDMKLDENMGEDNTIIMQVIKAGTQLPPTDKPNKP